MGSGFVLTKDKTPPEFPRGMCKTSLSDGVAHVNVVCGVDHALVLDHIKHYLAEWGYHAQVLDHIKHYRSAIIPLELALRSLNFTITPDKP